MELAEERDRVSSPPFFGVLTLAEWSMGLLCLVIAAIGAAGVFFAVEGPSAARPPVAAPAQASVQPAAPARRVVQPGERAWVEIGGIVKDTTAVDPRMGSRFRYAIYPRNMGQSPASDVLVLALEASDTAAFKANRRGIKMSQDQLFFQAEAKKRVAGERPGPESLGPGQQSPVPLYAGGAAPRRAANGLLVYSYILGRIDYIDVFGAPHWHHFCFLVLNPQGELGNCDYGNDKDDFAAPA